MLALPTKFKKVIQDISGTAGLDLIDPSIFSDAKDLLSATKGSVSLDCRCFTETPIDSRKCVGVICKVIYLLLQGVEFTQAEKTDIFFASTRLFQSSSAHLRRMVYLLIKVLSPSPEEAFVVTSSLTKDISSPKDLFRANAFRTIIETVDAHSASQLDRFLKAALVDKNPHVASTALLCGLKLSRTCPELVRRWINEVSDCVLSEHCMVQFHALALLYDLKRHDGLAVHRLIATLTSKIKSVAITECLLVRYATKLLALPGESPLDGSLLSFLEGCLQHRSEIVSFEAARAFVSLVLDSPKFQDPEHCISIGLDISQAITALQILLTSPKPVIRFAAMRILYRVSQSQPALVRKCNVDIEPLITDSCRAVAVLAVITLLKTGHDTQIKKIIQQISKIKDDISESQRVEVVTALRSLCVTQPSQVDQVTAYLAAQLKDKSGYQSKAHAVDTLFHLAQHHPAVHEAVLLELCEFIEDCEHPDLCCHILVFFTQEVPKTPRPATYLRYIYNRVILETAIVRAAAIDALVRIATQCLTIRDDVITILGTRLLADSEDDIREQVQVALKCLRGAEDSREVSSTTASETDLEDVMLEAVKVVEPEPLHFSLEAMLEQLSLHIANSEEECEFDLSQLPTEDEYHAEKQKERLESEKLLITTADMAGSGAPGSQRQESELAYETEVRKLVPEGEDLGRIHHLTSPSYLTEREAEYVVQVVRHFWENRNYISLEVFVKNTLENQQLEDIELRLSPQYDSPFEQVAQTKIKILPFDSEKRLYILLKRRAGANEYPTCTFGAQLNYVVKDDQGDDFGIDDSYAMEPITITLGDYMTGVRLNASDFAKHWSLAGPERAKTINMSLGRIKGGLQAATDRFVLSFNMYKCEMSSEANRGSAQLVDLSGRILGSNELVLIQAVVVNHAQHGILIKVQIRCADVRLAEVISVALQSE